MSDSKNDVAKENEANVTKTSPLIIRLCSKTSNTSPDKPSVNVLVEDSSKIKTLTSDYNVKNELESNTENVRIAKVNLNQPTAIKSTRLKNLINDNFSVFEISKEVDKVMNCSDATKLKKSSISNMLEDDVSESKRRKLSQKSQEVLEHCQSSHSQLPLVMQSSNLHSDSGLDFGHDGGGTATTRSRIDMEQHLNRDDVRKSFHSTQTSKKEESGITAHLAESLSVKVEHEESNATGNGNLSFEIASCPVNVLKGRPFKHNEKKIKRNKNSNCTDAKEAANYEISDFTSNLTGSALSSIKELYKNDSLDRKTTVTPGSNLEVDNISSSQTVATHSLTLNISDKPSTSEVTKLKKTVWHPQKRKVSEIESSQSETAFSCPFKRFRQEKVEANNLSFQSINKMQNQMKEEEESSSSDELEAGDNSVGFLEITELEKMRESLKRQLSQDNDSIGLPAFSEKLHVAKAKMASFLALKEYVSDDSNDEIVNDETSSNYKIISSTEMIEDNFEQGQECYVSKINDQHIINIPEKNLQSSSSEKNSSKTTNKLASVADIPPLVMQSSNLLLNDGLDNKHGGGGKETSKLKMDIKHELPLDSDDSKDEDSIIAQNDSKATDNETFINGKTVESDDSTSNPAGNAPNDSQNGMMEFDILDDYESDENDGDEDSSSDSDISTDEIDAMLEEGLQRRSGDVINKDIEHEEKEKVILKVRGRDHFDVLPEGWIEVTHNSGMPIYLHKQSRVCSVSKPYFLGPGSTRKHEIPVSAIPCLHYLRELEKEQMQAEEKEKAQVEGKEANGVCLNENSGESNYSVALNQNEKKADNLEKTNANPVANGIFLAAKLETVKDTKESGSLNYLDIREYCKKRFEFQTITVKRFRTWSGRRKHQKQIKRKQRPFLPDNTKLITCPLLPSDKSSAAGNSAKREFIMNPSGKSPVCILHEYVQHTLRVQPKYIFKELESASTPYGAIVLIDNIEYGYGFGSSKKLAKSDAAKAALEILIPKMKMFAPDKNDTEAQNVDFFDQVRVEDPRVCELSVKAGQPYPYQILLECLKRNYGMGDTEITFQMKNLKHQKNEFYMKVGKHEISVVCKNKRDGKHRASQAILQKLHPHINSWGSLLRMYGKGSHKTMKEKKEEEQRITELQSQACVNKPNMSILNKLKEEMLKYREKVKSMKPIGKLIPERMECFSTSSSNLKNVEL